MGSALSTNCCGLPNIVLFQRCSSRKITGLRSRKALEIMLWLFAGTVAAGRDPTDDHVGTKAIPEYMGLRDQVAELKETIFVRRKIERAKAVIMRRSDVDESEAYNRLRRIAMDSRSKIVEAADKILHVEGSLARD